MEVTLVPKELLIWKVETEQYLIACASFFLFQCCGENQMIQCIHKYLENHILPYEWSILLRYEIG